MCEGQVRSEVKALQMEKEVTWGLCNRDLQTCEGHMSEDQLFRSFPVQEVGSIK